MKKLIMSLIFLVVLVSCNSPAENPQSSSPSSTVNATQAPASVVDASWKTYTNAEAGFSIQYPSTWQQQDLPDENDGQQHHITLQGTEGGIDLIWGVGLGGACPEGWQSIPVANGNWPACHSLREDGTELWSLAAQPIGNTSVAGFVNTNDTSAESRALVLQVVSTLSFP